MLDTARLFIFFELPHPFFSRQSTTQAVSSPYEPDQAGVIEPVVPVQRLMDRGHP